MEVEVAVVKIAFFGLNGRGRRLLSQSRYAALDLTQPGPVILHAVLYRTIPT